MDTVSNNKFHHSPSALLSRNLSINYDNMDRLNLSLQKPNEKSKLQLKPPKPKLKEKSV